MYYGSDLFDATASPWGDINRTVRTSFSICYMHVRQRQYKYQHPHATWKLTSKFVLIIKHCKHQRWRQTSENCQLTLCLYPVRWCLLWTLNLHCYCTTCTLSEYIWTLTRKCHAMWFLFVQQLAKKTWKFLVKVYNNLRSDFTIQCSSWESPISPMAKKKIESGEKKINNKYKYE
jgi:hypothetical protein